MMSLKVCRVVNAHMLIRAGKELLLEDERLISDETSLTSFIKLNLHIF